MEKKSLNFILENIKIEGTAVVRDKDGNIKDELKLETLDVTFNESEEHSGGRD